MGKQLWYIQDRAKDAIKAGKPVAGQPSACRFYNSPRRSSSRLADTAILWAQ